MRIAVIAVLGLILMPVGCGEDNASKGLAKMSACSEVWVEGAELPKDYEGCKDGNRVVVPELLDCNDDGGRWTRYHQFAGVLGGQITVLPGSPDTESSQSSYILSC